MMQWGLTPSASSPSLLSSSSSSSLGGMGVGGSGGPDADGSVVVDALLQRLQRLQKENQRLAHQFAQLHQHNTDNEAQVHRLLGEAQEAAGEAERIRNERDDLAGEVESLRRAQQAADQRASQAAQRADSVQAELAQLRRAHERVLQRAEIARHASTKYETALTHARRTSTLGIEAARESAAREAAVAYARVVAENEQLRAQVVGMEAELREFQAEQERRAMEAEQAEEEADAHGDEHAAGRHSRVGSCSSISHWSSGPLSPSRFAGLQGSVDLGPGGANGTTAALFQYLQSIHHRKSGSVMSGASGGSSSGAWHLSASPDSPHRRPASLQLGSERDHATLVVQQHHQECEPSSASCVALSLDNDLNDMSLASQLEDSDDADEFDSPPFAGRAASGGSTVAGLQPLVDLLAPAPASASVSALTQTESVSVSIGTCTEAAQTELPLAIATASAATATAAVSTASTATQVDIPDPAVSNAATATTPAVERCEQHTQTDPAPATDATLTDSRAAPAVLNTVADSAAAAVHVRGAAPGRRGKQCRRGAPAPLCLSSHPDAAAAAAASEPILVASSCPHSPADSVDASETLRKAVVALRSEQRRWNAERSTLAKQLDEALAAAATATPRSATIAAAAAASPTPHTAAAVDAPRPSFSGSPGDRSGVDAGSTLSCGAEFAAPISPSPSAPDPDRGPASPRGTGVRTGGANGGAQTPLRVSASNSPSSGHRTTQSSVKRKGKVKKSSTYSFGSPSSSSSPRTSGHLLRSIPTPARLAAELRAIVSSSAVTPEQREAGDRAAPYVAQYRLPVQCAVM